MIYLVVVILVVAFVLWQSRTNTPNTQRKASISSADPITDRVQQTLARKPSSPPIIPDAIPAGLLVETEHPIVADARTYTAGFCAIAAASDISLVRSDLFATRKRLEQLPRQFDLPLRPPILFMDNQSVG